MIIFESLFEFLSLYLIVLCAFCLLGAFFQNRLNALKKKELESIKQRLDKDLSEFEKEQGIKKSEVRPSKMRKIYELCPCQRAASSGLASKLCIYSGGLCFMLSLSNIAFVASDAPSLLLLILSFVSLYIGWVLKK